MPLLRLAPDQQRAHDVAHAVRHEDGRGHEALLRVPRHVRHPQRDHQAHHRPERPDDAVPHDGRRGAVRPARAPDDGAARDDGQAAQHEQRDARVAHPRRQPARREDRDEAQRAERELEQDRVQRRPAERLDDQRAEARHGAVGRVRRRHHDEDEPGLGVEQGLAHLRGLELGAAHAGAPAPQPLDGDDALVGRQEPGRGGAAGHEEAPEGEEDGEAAGEEVDVLPAPEGAAGDLAEAVVEGAADDGEEARAGEPPALAQRLLLLRVVAGDDGHEGRGDDGLDEAEEEALHEEPAVRRHGRREHADQRPEEDDGAEHPGEVEALQREGHGVEAGEHAEVEDRRCPGEARRVDRRRRRRGVGHGEGEVRRHAEEGGGAEDRLGAC